MTTMKSFFSLFFSLVVIFGATSRAQAQGPTTLRSSGERLKGIPTGPFSPPEAAQQILQQRESEGAIESFTLAEGAPGQSTKKYVLGADSVSATDSQVQAFILRYLSDIDRRLQNSEEGDEQALLDFIIAVQGAVHRALGGYVDLERFLARVDGGTEADAALLQRRKRDRKNPRPKPTLDDSLRRDTGQNAPGDTNNENN